MERRNGHADQGIPTPLLRPTPRHVRPNASGWLVVLVALALVMGGLWGGADLHRRAKESRHRAALFAAEAVTTDAEVISVQRRGGGDDRRSVVHYRYLGGNTERTGRATMRRRDRDRYAAGSRASVRYLASDPDSSWIEGHAPRSRPYWPAFATPLGCIVAAGLLLALMRRQSHLLTYGRPALGVVTKVEKKRSDKGTYWRVHYEWKVLSGGTREGRYNHGRNEPPSIGTVLPLVYDRDSEKSARYPLSLMWISCDNN